MQHNTFAQAEVPCHFVTGGGSGMQYVIQSSTSPILRNIKIFPL